MYTYLQLVEIRLEIKKIINHPDKESLLKEMLSESEERPVFGNMLSDFELRNFKKAIQNSENITFEQHLQQLLFSKKIVKDSVIYNKANLGKDYWSKLRSGKIANPSRKKLIRIGLVLELTGTELNEFLKKAGLALNSEEDCPILWFINKKNYDLSALGQALESCNKLSLLYDADELKLLG